MQCTKPRQPAFNLPYGSHVTKHDTRFLIGHFAFLTCGKSDTRHLIGFHRFANENLLCGFSECKSQYVYNKTRYVLVDWSKFYVLFHAVFTSYNSHTKVHEYVRCMACWMVLHYSTKWFTLCQMNIKTWNFNMPNLFITKSTLFDNKFNQFVATLKL